MTKTLANFRLDDEILEIIDQANEEHRIGNRTEVVEWLLREGARQLGVLEMGRAYWPKEIIQKYGDGAVVSVRLSGSVSDVEGQQAYRADARIDAEKSDSLEAEVVEGADGTFRILLFHPARDGFPALVFEELTEAQLTEAAEVSGWEDSPDLSLTLARRASELADLPITRLPGEKKPESPAEVVS